MDFKLAKEVYSSAWCIDPITFQELSNSLKFYQEGGEFKAHEQKGNAFGILAQDNVFTPNKIERMERNGGSVPEGSIAQYNFDSVITKGGGASHFGTKDISAQFTEMESNENVIGHLFKVESGGGAVAAIRYINEVANPQSRTKPLVTFFEDVNGSAAYVISSNSDWIIANDKHALVGSIGTMMEMSGFKNGEKDSQGRVQLRVYSDFSGEKNAEFENAINNADYALIKETILNPSALEIIQHVSNNRPNITDKQKRAAIFRSEEVVGTLIDGIGTFQSAIDKVKELAVGDTQENSQASTTPKAEGHINNNLKIKSMDLVKLKAEHPAVYAEAVAEGDTQGEAREQDRVGAFMAFNEIDPKAVAEKVKSGENMTQTFMAEMSVKQMGQAKLKGMEEESPKVTKIDAEVKTPEQIKAESDKQEMDELFKEEAE